MRPVKLRSNDLSLGDIGLAFSGRATDHPLTVIYVVIIHAEILQALITEFNVSKEE